MRPNPTGRPIPVDGTVLVHGPEGVGKYATVVLAAAQLGAHVMAVRRPSTHSPQPTHPPPNNPPPLQQP
jgi:hypothetical protein